MRNHVGRVVENGTQNAKTDMIEWDSECTGLGVRVTPDNIDLCFAAGVGIATATGEAAFEALNIGDLARTNDGRDEWLKCVTHQTIAKLFADAWAHDEDVNRCFGQPI